MSRSYVSSLKQRDDEWKKKQRQTNKIWHVYKLKKRHCKVLKLILTVFNSRIIEEVFADIFKQGRKFISKKLNIN